MLLADITFGFESGVMLRVVLLIYANINCAARSQHALLSRKILDYERSLIYFGAIWRIKIRRNVDA